MNADIRDKSYIEHEDVVALNFIRPSEKFYFRRHYCCGLRSHILEVLAKDDVAVENSGIMRGGLRWFPRAVPLKMMRIFRTRIDSFSRGLEEIRRLKMAVTYIGQEHIAMSSEFFADYRHDGKADILLCGLQEYVKGQKLDPWGEISLSILADRFADDESLPSPRTRLCAVIRKNAEHFIDGIKAMIEATGCIPDLAGMGNLVLTPSANIKLVDINNISKISMTPTICLDDRNYPVCDKSVEALSLLESKLLGRRPNQDEPLYRIFLDPQRMKAADKLHRQFHLDQPSTC